jgi:hypothetical protein
MRRKRDKFMHDMGRIHHARQRRKAPREHDRLLDEDKSVWQETWEDWHDGVEFRSQEFGALGTEVVRGVANEARKVGKGILKEGVDLALDFLVSAATLGLAEQPSVVTKRRSRWRRRGR